MKYVVRIVATRLGAIAAIGMLGAASAHATPSMVDWGPKDMHREVRQVTMRFSDEMVALGDDKAADPAELHCTGTDAFAKGHWLDGRRWVAEFARPLPDGVMCSVKPHALKTLAGIALDAPAAWSFNTGGARVQQDVVRRGVSGEVAESSLVALLPSATVPDENLKQLRCSIDRRDAAVTLLHGPDRLEALDKLVPSQPSVTRSTAWLVVRCGKTPWPPGATIALTWDRNIASATGLRNEMDQVFYYRVRPAFTGQLTCSRLAGTPDCDPRQTANFNTHLHFSEAIAQDSAKAIKLRGASGAVFEADSIPSWFASRIMDLSFHGDFSRETDVTLDFPANLKDVDGRALTNAAALATPMGMAHLPAYVGMPKRAGVLQWTPGHVTSWPVVTRAAGAGLKVRSWRFTPGNANMATLLRLQEYAESGDKSINPGSWGLHEPFATSAALLTALRVALPPMQEQELVAVGDEMNFTATPLSGYGVWLVEADSPAFRATLELQRQELVRRNLIDDESPQALYVNVDADGSVLFDAKRYDVDAALEDRLAKVAVQQKEARPDIVLRSNLPQNDMANAAVRAMLARVGLDIKRSIVISWPHDGVPPARSSAAVQAWVDSRLAVVQVTNLNVQFIASPNGDSLAWVTAFDTGLPVADATVEIWSGGQKKSMSLKTDAKGRALVPAGLWPSLALAERRAIVVRSGDDMAIISTWPRNNYFDRAPIGHTILDRTLFHPGETLSMQHLARMPSKDGWSMPRLTGTSTLRLYYGYGSPPVAELPISWNEDGRAASSWAIPESAKLGGYRFELAVNGNVVINHGEFQIEEFRPPMFDATLSASADWHGEQQNLVLLAHLSFMSGGAAAGVPVVLKGTYRIGAPGPDPAYRYYSYRALPKVPGFADMPLTLDREGSAHANVAAPRFDLPLMLGTEMQFADPNGETQTVSQRIAVWPSRHKLGVKLEANDAPAGLPAGQIVRRRPQQLLPTHVDVIAFDEKDARQSGQTVQVAMVDPKGVHAALCSVSTDAQGTATCELPQKYAKNMEDWSIEVRAADASTVLIPMHEFGYLFNSGPAPEVMLALADQQNPKLGENIRLRVRAPFLPATMLLAVEREGIFASEVHALTRAEEIIEVPTARSYLPSVVLAAKFVRTGQSLSAPKKTDVGQDSFGAGQTLNVLFDDSAAMLKVDVTPELKTMLPGTHLPVTVKVVRESDGAAAAGTRLTLVAVDDALLTLKPNPSWSVLARYWQQRYTDVSEADIDTSWFLGHLFDHGTTFVPSVEQYLHFRHAAGGREYEDALAQTDGYALMGGASAEFSVARPMAAPAPAAGAIAMRAVAITGSKVGADQDDNSPAPRTNFSTLAFWKTDVVLDDHGKAQVVIPMPDSLTRWRIVAIATSGADRFGSGEAVVATEQPMQILSGMPQTVRSDDVLMQKLTLRNASDKTVKLVLAGSTEASPDPELPLAGAAPSAEVLAARGLAFNRQVTLEPRENRVVEWQIAVPDGVRALTWHIEARDGDGKRLDAIEVRQVVVPAVAVTVRESTLLHLDKTQAIQIAQPAGARPGRGGVALRWQASLVDAAMVGVRGWMAQYPYGCLEQLASKAAVSGDAAKWREVVALLPKMTDAQGLLRYFPETPGSEILTAYLLDLADAYGLELPSDQVGRMRGALRAALQHEVAQADRPWLTDNGLLPRRLALQASIAPELGDLKPTMPADLDALPTIALLDWIRYLQKSPGAAARNVQLDKASDNLRNRFDMQGTRLTLRHDGRDNLWWFMWNADVAEARAALLIQRSMTDDARWKGLMPTLIGALVERQKNGHWATTVANAWGGAALQEFAASSEKEPVTGYSEATMDLEIREARWPDPPPSLLPWPQQGARTELALQHKGSGAPWVTVQLRAAVNPAAAISHGVSVARSVEPVEQRVKGKWSVGDVMRVTLTMHSDANLSWLVVRDPIPSGATILGKGLGRESQLALGASSALWWWHPSSAELGSESYRGYYQYVWQGEWKAAYVLRLNNAGTFTFPATRIEAMYAPEIFGENPIGELQVAP